MMGVIANERLSWRLAELSSATGLSLPFLRKEARLGKLPTKKISGAVVVLHRDVLAYLQLDDERANNEQN